ncbi:Synaptogyrin [Gryllus bimaculatus]|nr:Synaptogyrin [Gryllus bimaculatus]
MDAAGAYGGGKAGTPFDPIQFVQRPQVILRGLCLAGCAWFAFLRFRQGSEAAFAPSYEADPAAMPGGGPYTSYPMGQEADAAYQEPPFSGSQTRGPVGTDFQAPAY